MSLPRSLLIVIAVGVALRVGSALYQGSTIGVLPAVTDEISYHGLALRLLDGHGFSFDTGWWPATRANHPTAHWSYPYVLFLSGVYALAGAVPLVPRLLQAVLVGILHPLLVWRIGSRLFGPSVGLAAAAATAVYGYFVFYAGALVTESLFFVAVLWVVDLATGLASAPSDRRSGLAAWIWLGVACAAAALLRQVFLLVVPAILAWVGWRLLRTSHGDRGVIGRRALARGLVVTVAVVAVCILPWTARNYRAFGEFVLLNTNAGFAFFWGNHPVHHTEFIPILPNGPVNYLSLIPSELETLNEAQLDRALLARGIGFVIDDPARYLRLSMSRATEYFKFWPSEESGAASNAVRVFSYGLALPLLVVGFTAALVGGRVLPHDARSGSPGAGLLILVGGLYALVHLLTWTLVRYRLPVDAVLMPFVGLGIVFLLQRASDPRTTEVPSRCRELT